MWPYSSNISPSLALGRVYMRHAGRRNSGGSSRTYDRRQSFLTMPSIKGTACCRNPCRASRRRAEGLIACRRRSMSTLGTARGEIHAAGGGVGGA